MVMHTDRILGRTALFCTFTLVTACGGDRQVADVAAIAACALLDSDDVAAVLGSAVTEGEAGIPADALMQGSPAVECRWATADGGRTLTLVLRRGLTAADAEMAMAPVREAVESGGSSPTVIEDLGDDAFFAFNQMHVRSASDYLTVTVSGLSNDTALEAGRNAARRALAGIASTSSL
jgi:hypothetical protein